MQESFWWWQCSDRYIVSLFPHPHSPFSPSLISLMASVDVKHQVYLITAAIIVYNIRLPKLWACWPFCVCIFVGGGAQTAVSLKQTTHIVSDSISFITAHIAYASTNKTKLVWIENRNCFCLPFTRGGLTSSVFTSVHTLTLCCFAVKHVVLIPKPFVGRWQRRWTDARRSSATSAA